ncbi:hypothetical protein HNQ94_000956 [Salirhabdus euzebyi]|uniref:DUF5643 domain-containing protein n=1 Tax=Salirhabdus euzebyi TaxID=394506 RepID=A0A841PZ41_9BACI|nr:hypothetical protein [Salirhabdus euzebyi]MBB6452511.1 hypothetical protein [Salirhabdus euzebyi]
MGKIIRRTLIIVCLFILIPDIIYMVTEAFSRDLPREIREKMNSGETFIIDVDEEVKLDQDIIEFEQILMLEDETLLLFEVHNNEPGWSFPATALSIKDDKGNNYTYRSGSSSGKKWGSIHFSNYDALPNDVQNLVIDFSWFDRSFRIEVPVDQEDR